ncbi:energy transducer TonB [Avrilella dinanensis]|uniref:energy transducer TonB n=1 Tax=Avrilella dinanensis TaxID=2008672 RepID=UPI00240984D5|nr:energy transducer TonB [Avrilella dinanensis]
MVVKMRDRVEEEIREFTEQKAEPVDGMVQFLSDYRRRFRMPDGIPSDVKQLSVRLKFVIEKDGTLSDIQALNNDYGIGNEGIRVLKSMPKWKPAMQDGVPVRSSFTWHYNFIVNNKL